MRRLVEWVAAKLGPPRIIYDHAGDGSPYLSRYYLRGNYSMTDGSSPYDEHGNPKTNAIAPKGIGIYLHRFHRGDNDMELHNHPWKWSFSIILVGGYIEERRVGDRVIRRVLRAGRFNWIGSDDFHRVDLLDGDAWTLFVAGPKFGSWGFWDRFTKVFTPWREFLAKRQDKGQQPL